MAGCISTFFVVLCVVAAKLGDVVIALPGAFKTLKYVGAAHLIYLETRARRHDAITYVEAPRRRTLWR